MRTVDRFDWWLLGAAGTLSVLLGTALVTTPDLLLLAGAVGLVAAVVTFAPLRWVGTAIVFGLLVTPDYEYRGLLVADAALLVALMVSLVRGRAVRLNAAHWAWAVFLGWAVLVTRSGPGLVPLLHTFAPLAGGYLVARLIGPDDLWRAVRWWTVICLAAAPLYVADLTQRWHGLPGSPNDLGLLAAALVVLAYAAPVGSRWRLAQVAVGFAGLTATRSVSAGVAAVIGVLLVRPPRSRGWLSPVKVAVVAGVALVLAARHDLLLTVTIHSDQARATSKLFDAVNPLTGGGWLYGARAISAGLFGVFYDSVHNVYLQLLTDTGLVGLVLFLAALYVTWRESDRLGRAMLVTVAVWLNTIGAFPGAGWGLLGVVLAATVRSALEPLADPVRVEPLHSEVRAEDDRRPAALEGV